MVWKIFAPKFIYEGITSYLAFAAILIGFAITARTEAALRSLVTRIQLNKNKVKL